MTDRTVSDDELTALSFASIIVRRARLFIVLPALFLAIVIASMLIGPSEYAAPSIFQPETESTAGRLEGLAAQFGVAIPSGGGGESLDFYTTLVESREILRDAVNTQYSVTEDGGARSGDLVELLGVDGDTRPEQEARAMADLADRITTRTDLDAGVVSLEVTAPGRELAMKINRRLLELLNQFNLEKRQSRAAAERGFVETRLESAQRDLLGAEQAMERFLEQNRTYQSSPQLSFEAQRLQRQIEQRQQVYNSLSQAAEEARIGEVRSTPVLTVIDPPEQGARSTATPLRDVVVALMLGLITAAAIAVILEYWAHLKRTRPEQVAEIRRRLPFGRRASA